GILPVSQDEHVLAADVVRYVGEPVAAVAAVDEATALAALKSIEVEYEVLAAATTIEEALDATTPRLHAGGPGPDVHRAAGFEFGDVEEGFGLADHLREDLFYFSGNTHAPMEQHCAVADAGLDGRLTVWSSTQVPHYLHRALARVLETPASRIRVIATPVGGGFGGKTDLFGHEFAAAHMARVTGRPVKFTLTREEVFYAHRGRHPALMWVKTGFRRDGSITAMAFRTYLDGGAYGSYGAASLLYTGALQTATYRIPAYRFEGLRAFTAKPPCGPKRGHGTPQPRFALECHLDQAAEDLGLDPESIRAVNLVEPFSLTVNHLRITSCGLRECIDAVIEASDFHHKRGSLPKGRGVGLAVGSYLSGAALPIYWNEMPQSEVHIKVDRGGGVTVSSMAAEVGQGSNTILVAIVAEVLGLEPGDVGYVVSDTDLTPVDLGSYSSRVTFMAGNAALQAAERLRSLVASAVAAELGAESEKLHFADGRVATLAGESLSWIDAVERASTLHGPLTSAGSYRPPDVAGPYKGSGVGPSPAYSFTAAVVEVSCDDETGQVAVEKVWIAHDIGRPINRLMVEGQIEGSVHMALGEALMEEQAYRGALVRSPSLLEYKMPSILEMPEVFTFLIETDDPEGPFGAKEVGQGPLLPVIPAVANAVYDAIGIRFDQIPIS
ncbi:MAG: molybdopterin-dependent oxidoreductase, partial [Acidimicrobiia bacterium]|nr:molybdopterin-dependent oxidoreductase [Acidimicrobiia bacterium]